MPYSREDYLIFALTKLRKSVEGFSNKPEKPLMNAERYEISCPGILVQFC